jgi:uncharacterized membrane protein YedE/YeeE
MLDLGTLRNFTPTSALVGGALIALSLALMLVGTGRVAGLSGIFAGFLRGTRGDWAWRALFVAGMAVGGVVFARLVPGTFDAANVLPPLPVAAASGVLVGLGTRLSNGCTSGHGLCGMSRLSVRSIVATAAFFGIGLVTATVAGQWWRHPS